MADDRKVSGTVAVESDSRQRVALDLAIQVATEEGVERDREYWFKLYEQCLSLTYRSSAQKVLSRN